MNLFSKKKTYTYGVMIFGVMVLLWSCAGHGTYFRERWWNFFERATAYEDQGLYDQALADLGKAISQRSEDQRMARTYGMHFIDYFPHRERGIIYYHQGYPDKAEEELELSIGQYPSAKARYFLDLVRKDRVTASGLGQAPPVLSLDNSESTIWTRSDPVRISGTARDPAFVSQIYIGNERIFQEGTEKEISFSRDLNLAHGYHRIVVSAMNLAGQKSQNILTIHVDRKGPLLVMDAPEKEPQGIRIRGTAVDRAGVESLFANGVKVPIPLAPQTDFNVLLALGTPSLSLESRDCLGNQTRVEIPLERLVATQQEPLLLAANSTWPGGSAGNKDRKTPEIHIRDWNERQVVFLAKIYLDGMVQDGGGIGSLTINGEEILERSGVLVAFNQFIELAQGENRIRVEARDFSGNRSSREIVIERRVPSVLQLKERMSLTVFPFEHKGTVISQTMDFQSHVISALIRENRFRVVDRDYLERIMEEQNISQSGLVDSSTCLAIGKLASAQAMVAGTLVESRDGYEIVSRVVDTETSEILAMVDVFSDKKDREVYRQLAWGLASKIHREFPLSEGRVLDHQGNTLITDLGEQEIKLSRRLLVYQTNTRVSKGYGPIPGEDYRILGRARVTRVGQETSLAVLVSDIPQESGRDERVIAE
ncbi:MAG: hypothetical protein KKD44_20460 [Proteobacteria bacterium]|nr:hypothetical protein [Pseudomonadota bacterium]